MLQWTSGIHVLLQIIVVSGHISRSGIAGSYGSIFLFFKESPYYFPGFSRWLSGKESACQCRKFGSNLWMEKILWRREWQPTPEFLPGKSHGQRRLAVYSPWSCKRVRHNWVTEHPCLYTVLHSGCTNLRFY